ncbi:type VII secretion protein EccB [Streptomyces halobius]|uniref:Type VII secretion protein EccB n=1 Tax=Streptomyces halobius TaxID=2879846 RepID=A0ABY4M7H2_9ACTN|nr:type VII secretion protein EccB [Streptomyces halobius]UQA92774.1 type VII secretion protein EccB [Streptomyces halobius]
MASRRDELNAYSFARKRTNAAFLKPLPNGSIESAPRPLKAVMPSIIIALLILVGFGACGILKPVAPQGWDEPYKHVIVGADSTTRYVVLPSKDANGKKQKLLHPVLNLASAKLLLDPKYTVVNVKESELDGKLTHGPAVGIPYAPDRLPSAEEADKPKIWAVCNRPGSGTNSKPQQAVFVLGGKEKKLVEGSGKLAVRQALYVRDPDGQYWLVDQNGVAFQFSEKPVGTIRPKGIQDNRELRQLIFGAAEAQDVTQDWMNTVIKSPVPLSMPTFGAATGQQRNDNGVPAEYNKVGMVVENSASGEKYVVTPEGVQQVTNFVAKLLLKGQNATDLGHTDDDLEAKPLPSTDIDPQLDDQGKPRKYLDKVGATDFDMPWPQEVVTAANNFRQGSQTGGLTSPTDSGVSCSVYTGSNLKYPGAKFLGYPNGVPKMQTWIGKDYPAKIASGSTSYVTPGSGLLYQEVKGSEKDGRLYLVTDTGLRYNVPVGNDSKDKAGNDKQERDQARLHLGYKGGHPPLIPATWSELLSKGPSLNVYDAKKPQSQ